MMKTKQMMNAKTQRRRDHSAQRTGTALPILCAALPLRFPRLRGDIDLKKRTHFLAQERHRSQTALSDQLTTVKNEPPVGNVIGHWPFVTGQEPDSDAQLATSNSQLFNSAERTHR